MPWISSVANTVELPRMGRLPLERHRIFRRPPAEHPRIQYRFEACGLIIPRKLDCGSSANDIISWTAFLFRAAGKRLRFS